MMTTGAHFARPNAVGADAVLRFWFEEATPRQWFRRDEGFDQTIRERFGALHEAASIGAFNIWRAQPRSALALIIVLDQFSRNIYRDTPKAFSQDWLALDAARDAIKRRFDQLFDAREQAFFYMPFMHTEDLGVQEESVALFKTRLPQTGNLSYAIEHRDIVKRFGRFPHRNKILGRKSTQAETAFLKAGGFNP